MRPDLPRPSRAALLASDNLRMVGKLAVIAVLMFGFGYALVPVYRAICTALGINVLSVSERLVPGHQRAGTAANTQVDRSRTITIEFDANARGPWDFKPALRSLQVHPGEMATVMYEFRNKQTRTMAAQAIPSYAPKQATGYFNKLECFCFNEYTLAAGERKEWPVVFVIDPKLPKDVTTITLSYTFFEVGGKTPPAPDTSVSVAPAVAVGGGIMSSDGLKQAVQRKASFGQTMRAVAWSFFGVRKSSDYERDVQQLNPLHVAIAGIGAAVVFIVVLLLVVNWVLSSGVAA